MVTTNRLFKTLLALFLLSADPALAADTAASLHFVGRYDFDWSGVALGKLVFALDETPDAYALRLQVNSAGIVNLFTRHESYTEASGRRQGDRYLPAQYESHYKTKNKPRHIKLAFDGKGAVTQEIVEPPEDPTERPVVPHAQKDGSYDPLSGFMLLRAGRPSVRVFDAKHLLDVKAEPKEKTVLRLALGRFPVAPYILSRTPVAGLTAKEAKEYSKGEPPLAFYFSDDARRVPIAMILPLYFGQVRGMLVKECTTWDECKLQ